MKPFLAALAVSISFTSFAGGSVVVGDTQRRESSLSEEPHYSDAGASLSGPVQRMELGAGSTPAHQQPVPQGAVTAPLSRAAGTRGENPGNKFREESETDSQQTAKSESQYGRAVPHHLGEPWSHHRRIRHAEAEGQKRIEVAQAPSRNRTLEFGETGETKAGGDILDGPIDGGSVGGLTARRDERKWPLIGKVQTASLVALALADYDSTQRGLARGGREVGLVLSCGGQLCQGRYTAINAGVVLGTYAITRYAIPRLPQRWRRVTNIMLSGMIGGRGLVVVSNYRKAARIK